VTPSSVDAVPACAQLRPSDVIMIAIVALL
jgi:hypothetical protein